jgi:hypothetical protein
MIVTSGTGPACLLRPDEFDVPLSIRRSDEPRDTRKQVAGRRHCRAVQRDTSVYMGITGIRARYETGKLPSLTLHTNGQQSSPDT